MWGVSFSRDHVLRIRTCPSWIITHRIRCISQLTWDHGVPLYPGRSAVCFGVMSPGRCRPAGSYLSDLLFNCIFIPAAALISGTRGRGFGPVTHSAELLGEAPLLSWRQRGAGIWLVQSEPWASEEITTRGGKKRRENEADLKNSPQMSVYLGWGRPEEHGSWIRLGRQSVGRERDKYPRGLTRRRGGKQSKDLNTSCDYPDYRLAEKGKTSGHFSVRRGWADRRDTEQKCLRSKLDAGRIFTCCRVNFAVDVVLNLPD